jgi:hypothetical protein
MGNKKHNTKKVSKSKEASKDRKKTERSYGDIIKSGRGQKRTINPKRHRGKHTKGTRKGSQK